MIRNDNSYNSKNRLHDVLKGKEVDRTPVYTLIPFAIKNNHFIPGAFHGYKDIDDWRIKDPLYVELVSKMEIKGDNFFVFRPPSMDAQNIFISTSALELVHTIKKDNKTEKRYAIDNGVKKLYKTEKFLHQTGHSWITEHFCKTIDDALSLLNIQWEKADDDAYSFFSFTKELGNNGLFWVTIPSPVMAVCRLFDPQDFLLFSILHRSKIDKLMQVAYQRIKDNLINLLEQDYGPIIRFGGAEYVTPPMMSPADFDWLVYQYDKPLIDICKRYNKKVAVHCHGNIRHAIKRFMEMRVDQIDPVEATPFGDITMKEIREITSGQITLTGNIQYSELVNESPEYIKKRVHDLIKIAGPERLIISTTGTPLEKISDHLYNNYIALIEFDK